MVIVMRNKMLNALTSEGIFLISFSDAQNYFLIPGRTEQNINETEEYYD